MLDADAGRKREMSRLLGPEELILTTTVGLDFTPDPQIDVVVLTPQIAMRPWNIVRAQSPVLVICYPMSDEGAGLSPSDTAQLARLYKALGEEKRLLILKVLSRSERSLDDLAKELGIAKSLVLYHLGLLRSAGLVRTGSDYSGLYRIRPERIPEVGPALRQFLRG